MHKKAVQKFKFFTKIAISKYRSVTLYYYITYTLYVIEIYYIIIIILICILLFLWFKVLNYEASISEN